MTRLSIEVNRVWRFHVSVGGAGRLAHRSSQWLTLDIVRPRGKLDTGNDWTREKSGHEKRLDTRRERLDNEMTGHGERLDMGELGKLDTEGRICASTGSCRGR